MCAPLARVTFLSTYIGDVLTSLTRVYADLAYSVCWCVSGGVLATSYVDDQEVRLYIRSAIYTRMHHNHKYNPLQLFLFMVRPMTGS